MYGCFEQRKAVDLRCLYANVGVPALNRQASSPGSIGTKYSDSRSRVLPSDGGCADFHWLVRPAAKISELNRETNSADDLPGSSCWDLNSA